MQQTSIRLLESKEYNCLSQIYQGEYEDLIDWITDTYPPHIYDNYYQWLGDVKQDFFKSGHHFSDDIADEMKGFWIQGSYGVIGKPERRTEKHNYDKVYNSLIEKNTFNLSQAYKANESRRGNYKDTRSFKGGIRRDIAKLVQQGALQRIGKGEYRII